MTLTNIILNLLIRNFWSTFVQIIVQNINGVLMAHLKLDTRETDIMPRKQGNEPSPGLKSDKEIDTNNANWDDNGRS